jgi:predicted TIM-barrel fold metal-dependent hydrolase
MGILEGVPDILWSTEFAVNCARFPNVYAEIGTTFASSVVTFPTVCAHLLGHFLKFFGEDRIVFGSDSPWYGGPQWQIEALWRLQIPGDAPEFGAIRSSPRWRSARFSG